MRKTLIVLIWTVVICMALAAVPVLSYLRGLLAWIGLVAILSAAGLTLWREAIKSQKAREREHPKPPLPVIKVCFDPQSSPPWFACRERNPQPTAFGPTRESALTRLLLALRKRGDAADLNDYEIK